MANAGGAGSQPPKLEIPTTGNKNKGGKK